MFLNVQLCATFYLLDPCLGNYTLVAGRCYKYDTNAVITWTQAQQYCSLDGAILVSITNEKKYDDIKNWLTRCKYIKNNYLGNGVFEDRLSFCIHGTLSVVTTRHFTPFS